MFRLLVVENNITNASLMARAVTDLRFGVNVGYALSTTQALYYLANLRQDPKKNYPDMILLSAALPDASAIEALSAINRVVKGQVIPVVVIAPVSPDNAPYYEHGASAVVEKPDDPSQFIDEVARTVRFVAMISGLVPKQPEFFAEPQAHQPSVTEILQVHL